MPIDNFTQNNIGFMISIKYYRILVILIDGTGSFEKR